MLGGGAANVWIFVVCRAGYVVCQQHAHCMRTCCCQAAKEAHTMQHSSSVFRTAAVRRAD
jgi:hypothetical protein